MFHNSPRPTNNSSSTYEVVSSRLKNEPQLKETFPSQHNYYLQNVCGHCTTQILESDWTLLSLFPVPWWFSCSICILSQQYPKNSQRYVIERNTAQSNFETMNSLKLIVHLATNWRQVLLYLLWKCKLPDSTSVSWWQYPGVPWWSLGNTALWQGII